MGFPVGLGVGIPHQMIADRLRAAEALRPAWWFDWGCHHTGVDGYVPMMYRHAYWQVTDRLKRYPDAWLGPNEPERGSQANMTPEACADEVKKAMRHGARMSWPAILLTPTERWSLQWFERFVKVWDGPEPEALTLHLYGVRGGTEWNELFEAWYRFLRTLGLDHSPTIVTETNFDHGDVNDQLGLLRYLAWRLDQDERMQAVAWFAARWDKHAAVNLLDSQGELTMLGRVFRELAQ